MAKPTSPIDICNLALAQLGQRPISSIDSPTTPAEDICAAHYDATRRALFREYVFNCLKKYDVLAEDSGETPAHGYSTAYAIPTDFIRLLAVGDSALSNDTPPSLYEVTPTHIYTDYGDDTDGLKITYIYDNETVATYDPLLVRLLTLQLARDMAYAFTLKPSLVARLDRQAEAAATAAAAISGQEKPPRRVERSRLRSVRSLGSVYRDNRYV